MVEAASRELSDGDLSVEIVVAVERGCQSWTNPLPLVRSPLLILEGVRERAAVGKIAAFPDLLGTVEANLVRQNLMPFDEAKYISLRPVIIQPVHVGHRALAIEIGFDQVNGLIMVGGI